MPIATRTDSALAPTLAQASLVSALKTALTAAGLSTLVDDYTSGSDRIIVYQIIQDASKVFGTSYLRVRITSTLTVATQILSGWTVATHSGSNASTELSFATFSTSVGISFYALNASPELNLVMIAQGATHVAVGVLSPYYRPSWWDLNSYSYAFIPTSNSLTGWRAPNSNPYTSNDYASSLGNASLNSPSRVTNRRSVGMGVILFAPSFEGDTGRTSDEIATCAAVGLSRYDLLQVPGSPNRDYLILNNAAGGIGVRVA